MSPFPSPDPIPLPAPVWLFKFLHNLTLTLHLAAVELVLGGLILGIGFALLGRARHSREMIQAGGIIAHRLPSVMSMLINLGVPPLLFAQVLYGPALYTSSVLIGAYWISVIFLLIASYCSLYFAAQRAHDRRQWAPQGLAALLLALAVAFIYSNNMTLMLRPQVWSDMYRQSPAGLQFNSGDPTLLPRWFLFVFGSLAAAGVGLQLLSLRSHFDVKLRAFLFRAGGIALLFGLGAELAFGRWAMAAQPTGVVASTLANPFYGASFALLVGAAVAGIVLAASTLALQAPRPMVAASAAVAGLLNLAGIVLVRDGIRDFTLRATGFEVWSRHVVTNWSVVGVFLLLLVASAAVIGLLIRVLAKARRVEEIYV